MDWKDEYWGLVFGPMAVGLVLGRFVEQNMKYQKKVLNVRPPGWVFGVAWFILYILFGTAWVFAIDNPQKDNVIDNSNQLRIWLTYGITLLLLYSWSFVFNRISTKYALYILLLSLLGTFICYTLSPLTSQILLSPLVIWLIFAGQMNYTITL